MIVYVLERSEQPKLRHFLVELQNESVKIQSQRWQPVGNFTYLGLMSKG